MIEVGLIVSLALNIVVVLVLISRQRGLRDDVVNIITKSRRIEKHIMQQIVFPSQFKQSKIIDEYLEQKIDDIVNRVLECLGQDENEQRKSETDPDKNDIINQ